MIETNLRNNKLVSNTVHSSYMYFRMRDPVRIVCTNFRIKNTISSLDVFFIVLQCFSSTLFYVNENKCHFTLIDLTTNLYYKESFLHCSNLKCPASRTDIVYSFRYCVKQELFLL